jgi:hypothetical protein
MTEIRPSGVRYGQNRSGTDDRRDIANVWGLVGTVLSDVD